MPQKKFASREQFAKDMQERFPKGIRQAPCLLGQKRSYSLMMGKLYENNMALTESLDEFALDHLCDTEPLKERIEELQVAFTRQFVETVNQFVKQAPRSYIPPRAAQQPSRKELQAELDQMRSGFYELSEILRKGYQKTNNAVRRAVKKPKKNN